MTTIVPEGDLVSAGAAKLRQSLYDAITNDPGGLTVDLANVRIVDSVGLGVLVAAHNTLGHVLSDPTTIEATAAHPSRPRSGRTFASTAVHISSGVTSSLVCSQTLSLTGATHPTQGLSPDHA